MIKLHGRRQRKSHHYGFRLWSWGKSGAMDRILLKLLGFNGYVNNETIRMIMK